MIRLTVVAVMFAIGTVSLATPKANAQSPDPALLAPGQSGRMLAAAAVYRDDRATRPRGHHDVYRSRTEGRLSHPSMHIH